MWVICDTQQITGGIRGFYSEGFYIHLEDTSVNIKIIIDFPGFFQIPNVGFTLKLQR